MQFSLRKKTKAFDTLSSVSSICLEQRSTLLTLLDRASTFQPKLTFTIDPSDGSPVDASLSPETRAYLLRLANAQRLQSGRLTELNDGDVDEDVKPGGPDNGNATVGKDVGERGNTKTKDEGLQGAAGQGNGQVLRQIEVPLTADSEFFQVLRTGLSNLDELQQTEQKRLAVDVTTLGREVGKVTNSTVDVSRTSLYAWREIFRAYMETQIFFATGERVHGSRNSTAAQKQLDHFFTLVKKDDRVKRLRKADRQALERFLDINVLLLQNLKFQEINQLAITKILKSTFPAIL